MLMMLSCEDTSGEVRMFRARTWGLLRAGRFTLVGSRVLDYRRGGPKSWTTNEEVRRVGLRAGRFVGAGPRVGKFVEACYIPGP